MAKMQKKPGVPAPAPDPPKKAPAPDPPKKDPPKKDPPKKAPPKKAPPKKAPGKKAPGKKAPPKKKKKGEKGKSGVLSVLQTPDPDPFQIAKFQVPRDIPSDLVIQAVSMLTKRGVRAQIACRIYGLSYSTYINWREKGLASIQAAGKLDQFGVFVRALDAAEAMFEAKLSLDAVNGLRPMAGQLSMLAQRFPQAWSPKTGNSQSEAVPLFEDNQAGLTHEGLVKAATAMAVLDALVRAQHPPTPSAAPEYAEAAIPTEVGRPSSSSSSSSSEAKAKADRILERMESSGGGAVAAALTKAS